MTMVNSYGIKAPSENLAMLTHAWHQYISPYEFFNIGKDVLDIIQETLVK